METPEQGNTGNQNEEGENLTNNGGAENTGANDTSCNKMAEEKKKEEDLGFLDGIKAELIPILIGLISFPLLAEKLINEIESFFLVSELWGMYLFNALYFLVPVLLVLLWLIIINSREGLKKLYFNPGWSIKKILLCSILFLLLLLVVLGFFKLSNFQFLIFSGVLLLLIIVYSATSFKSSAIDVSEENKKRLEQAKKQFLFGSILLLALLLTYFSCQILSNEKGHFDIYSDAEESFCTKIDSAAKDRERLRELDNLIDEIPNSIPSFPYVEEDLKASFFALKRELLDIPQNTSKGNTTYAKAICDSVHNKNPNDTKRLIYLILDKRIKEEDSLLRVIADSVQVWNKTISKKQAKKIGALLAEARTAETDELTRQAHTLKSLISFHQKQSLSRYQKSSKKWLVISQFKGLLIFNLTILFLLVVWFDAYTNKLKSEAKKNNEEFSEINTARVAIYLLFLLTIPFFKPIDEKSINLDKPYLSLAADADGTEASVHKSHDLSNPSDVAKLMEQMEKMKTELIKKTDTIMDSVGKVSSYQKKNLKKVRVKSPNPYDNESIENIIP